MSRVTVGQTHVSEPQVFFMHKLGILMLALPTQQGTEVWLPLLLPGHCPPPRRPPQ